MPSPALFKMPARFVFRVIEQGGDYLIDPWILFWETFRQQRRVK